MSSILSHTLSRQLHVFFLRDNNAALQVIANNDNDDDEDDENCVDDNHIIHYSLLDFQTV